jgi:GWxTD domain-containing protein
MVINCLVEDEKGTPVKRIGPLLVRKNRHKSAPWADLFYLGDLRAGQYKLLVEVIDLSNGHRVRKVREFFWRPLSQKLVPPRLNEDTWKYLAFIDYFASSQEIKEFHTLNSEESRKLFLWRFWKRFDTNKETYQNEFIPVFVERVKYADSHFSVGKREGRYTDRGRIYIKYGPPDEIKKKVLQFGERDMEKWTYYKRGGMEFIFVDIEGTGDYKLVYSSIPEEPTLPNWRKYVREENGW